MCFLTDQSGTRSGETYPVMSTALPIILTAQDRQFIQTHLTDDVRALLLRTPPPGVDMKILAGQITARQKAREKLPTWYANDELLFPPALSVEQASSEQTARYKASLVQGALLLDLTGGMGVDTWAFSQRVGRVVYVDRNPDLAQLAAYNLPRLGVANVTVQTGDGLALLNQTGKLKPDQRADWVYLDPHRRDEQGGRVVRLDACEPDLSNASTLNALLTRSQFSLVKTSPLLDLEASVRQLAGAVTAIHIVAVGGEVKEILFVMSQDATAPGDVRVRAVNLLAGRMDSLEFAWNEERTAEVTFGDPQRYIYEPNAAVLKAGAFRLVAARFGLTKLAPNSHLYTSTERRTNFPGRTFALRTISKPDANQLKQAVPDGKANLTVRNFPQTVAELRKKLNVREGGAVYILATTLLNGDKRLLITEKIDPPV